MMEDYVLFALLFSVSISLGIGQRIDRGDCETISDNGSAGTILVCQDGYYVVSSCGSGSNRDCNGVHAYIECCKEVALKEEKPQQKACDYWSSNDDAGTDLICPQGWAVTATCGSGSNKDCKLGSIEAHTAMQCCDEHSMTLSTCSWVRAQHGFIVDCPEDSVAAGICGSGRNLDCPESTSHGLYCCRFN